MVAGCGKVESPGDAEHQTESQHQVTLAYWNEQENRTLCTIYIT